MNPTPPPPTVDRDYADRVADSVRAGIARGPEAARPRLAAFQRFDQTRLDGLRVLLVRPAGVTYRDWETVIRGIELELFDLAHVDVRIATVDADLPSEYAEEARREALALDLPPILGDLAELRAASAATPPTGGTHGRGRR